MLMDYIILWLVPLGYLIHIAEEAPRFVKWTKDYPKLFSSGYNNKMFIFGNTMFMLYVLICTALGYFYRDEWALVLGLSTSGWLMANFLLHAVLTLKSGVYSPGTVTAGAVYVPVALFIYGSFLRAGLLSSLAALLSLIIGFAVMYVPFLFIPVLESKNGRKKAAKGVLNN